MNVGIFNGPVPKSKIFRHSRRVPKSQKILSGKTPDFSFFGVMVSQKEWFAASWLVLQ